MSAAEVRSAARRLHRLRGEIEHERRILASLCSGAEAGGIEAHLLTAYDCIAAAEGLANEFSNMPTKEDPKCES